MPEFSPIGRSALEEREDCRLEAYRDSVGVWTIACGVTTASGLIVVKAGLKITQAQADALSAKAFEKYADQVRKALGSTAVTQEQFDALVSLNYNIGPGNFGGSTVLRKLKAGDVAGAAEAILMWNKPAAVLSRRQGEYDQFRSSYSQRLPKARRTDRVPIAAPARPVGLPPASSGAPVTSQPASQPAPTGGLLRAGAQATGTATRGLLNGLFAAIHNALARKV